ncbi:hypothetical protein T484DRAFT_3632711 [Baffinella frigidus]|nr:hypothetical protein T484DRAFT_3632711 [Cryptophyta sp. CCMP2293]
MFTYPDTPAALRLHLVGMLGSDCNKELDVLYREFLALYGQKWEELAAMSDDPEQLPGEGNWDQFVIFRGFPVHQEDVFFSKLGDLSPSLDKCSAALVKLYKVFNVASSSPGRDTDAWRAQLKQIRSGHRTNHHKGIDPCDHLQHLISSIQERSPDELHPNLGAQLIHMVEGGVTQAHRRSEFAYYSPLVRDCVASPADWVGGFPTHVKMCFRMWKQKAAKRGDANMLAFRHPWSPALCPESSMIYYMAVCEVPEFGPVHCRLDADGRAHKAHHRELVLEDGGHFWAWFTEDGIMVNWSCTEISEMLRSCLDHAHYTSDDPVARRAFKECSDSHWMRVTGIKWVARAHGDIHVARKQSRCADGSTSVEIYWGEGRQVSDIFLHCATRDPIFRVLPCPKLGLNFTMSDAPDLCFVRAGSLLC